MIMLRPRLPVGCLVPQRPFCSPSETARHSYEGREYGQWRWGSLPTAALVPKPLRRGEVDGGAHTSLKMLTHSLASATRCSHPDSSPPPRAHPPITLSSELEGWGWRSDWLSLPRPHLNSTHTASGREAISSSQREGQGQESRKEGRRLRGLRGPGNPAG